MSFPRYPNYKDSGVEWLGEVPGHWKVDRLKRSTVSAKNGIWGDEAQQNENDIPCVRVADFDRQGLRVELFEPTIRNVIEKERVGRVLTQGDLLLEKSGGGETQPVGCVVLYDDPRPAVCSNFVARVQTAPGMDSSFWRYVHAAVYAVRLNTRSIKQTSGIQNLDASQYLDERAGFPPLPEQTQIAAFLDRETAKIDDLVVEQRRLMELLKEKRQAVISHAVTQGLNAHAPMKPSGIEWLGDVPAHWEVRKLNNIARLESGHTPSRQRPDYWIAGDCVIPWFTLADVGFLRNDRNTIIESTSQKISQVGIENSSARLLPFGTVILSRTASVGFSGITNIALAVSQDFAAWICSGTIQPRYLLSCLRAMKPEFQRLMMGSTHQTIYMPDIEAFRVPLPPVIEQVAIADFLHSATFKFDTLTAEAQHAIDLLQERRTALISAAVTGQIDVRGLGEPRECDRVDMATA